MPRTKSLGAGVVLTVLAVVVPASNAGMIIDSFEDVVEGAWPVTHTTGTQSTYVLEGGLSGVAGGWRHTSIGASAVDLPGIDEIHVNISPEHGLLDYASSVGSNGHLSLWYQGDPLGDGLHVDLSRDALIQIDFADFDLPAGAPMRVTVVLNEGLPPGRAPLTKWLTIPGAQSLEFPFAEFDDMEYVDLADLENILVRFSPPAGTDFRVDRIVGVVPEPATLAFLFAGCLALPRVKRRKGLRGAIVAMAIVAGLTVPTQAGTLVGSSFGVIYDIDPLTGLASNPRDTGGAAVRVGFGGGTLYGESARALYSIDFGTGTADLVGYLEGLEEYYSVQDLAWDPGTSSLFALVHVGGTSTDLLFTADTRTAAVTQIGVLDDAYTTMAFDSDGTLFALEGWDDVLAVVDKTSAETLSSIAVQGGVIPAAMAFDDTGQLYVAGRVDEDLSVLHTLDPYSGVLTPIGTTGLDLGVTSLTYIPEPATFALLLTGALALCYRTRQRSVRNMNNSCKGARATGRWRTGSPNVSLAIVLGLLVFAGRLYGEGVGLGPNPIYSGRLHGSFEVTGTSIAESAWDAWADPEPFSGEFTLEIDIPNTADVVHAYLNWSYLTTLPIDPILGEIEITINGEQVHLDGGTPVVSALDDICHLNDPHYEARTLVYLSDVTEIIAPGLDETGHGQYVFSDVVEDDDEDEILGPLGRGMSLLVVYSDSNEPLRLINVYSGLIQTDGQVWEAQATLGFFDDDGNPVRYVSGPFDLFLNALDGQETDDGFWFVEPERDYLASGINVSHCGSAGPAWCGNIGPTHEPGKDWYDHGEADLPAEYPGVMDEGDTTLTFKTVKDGDCIGISFAAVAFEYVPCPVIHVDADAPGGTGPGTSWDNAYHRLQDALANIDPLCAGPCATIRVAEGVYRPDQDENHILGSNDPAATFQLMDHVCLEGGYAG